MTAPDTPPSDPELTLSQALQRAFAEAGNPSLRTVAASGTGVPRQRLSDWRAGRHTPATFSDLEPVLAYLYLAAETARTEADAAEDPVTQWPLSQWQQLWQHTASAATTRSTEPAQPKPSGSIHHDTPAPIDRRPLALAVVTLLVVLVAALAVAAYLLSAATM
ncbi:hypothetical protein [Tsukamurella tyrosinosolvens]|uniref:hypothetical protein n=1 Tax=Tsukamurella tyrosinosolvens TaxID=57704 RepID=UPI002DD4259C|nr:hypothetical protein [Tsukamurella tyrosinosolvens]MEC4616430.1 hypothetical protein [Tsukamurella tyrosinosolvens]